MSLLQIENWTVDWDARGIGLENPSGDLHVVTPFPGGMLLAVIDGLGHGVDAARAAQAIAGALSERPEEPLDRLIQRCHERARGTRGAVITAATFRAQGAQLCWCAIGNVEGRLFRGQGAPGSSEAVTQYGGVVGYQFRTVRVSSLTVQSEDVLVLATDGIRSQFDDDIRTRRPAGETAADVLEQHARGTDDALVMVARFERRQP